MNSAVDDLGVAIDVTPLMGPRTGIGNYVAELWTALEKAPDGPRLTPYLLSGRASPESGDLPEDTVRLPVPARLAVAIWRAFDGPPFDRRLGSARVVHGTNFVAPPCRKRAVVVTVHDIAFHRFPEACSPDARRAGNLARSLARRGAWVHTPSQFVAREVRDLFATERVRAVPHGVPSLMPPSATSDAVPDGPYVLTIGTLEPRKRHAELVVAFGALAERRPDLQLVIAGSDGPARSAVESAAAALPQSVGARVHLVGRVDDQARSDLLHGAVAFAFPSAYEGFGLPVVEAMAAGTPVVTAPAGGVAEQADGAAVVYEGGAAGLAEALERVLDDEALARRLVQSGHERVARLAWASTADQMIALYREAAP